MVERILDAAARVFVERGYHGATTNHVAEAAGASIGSLYQYFSNKDALLAGIAERHIAEALEELSLAAKVLRSAQPDVETVCRTLVGVAIAVNRPSPLHQILWTAPRSGALNAALGELDDFLIDEVSWHLRRFGCSGEVATMRATVLVVATSAVIHEIPVGDTRDEELVRMCIGLATANS
jgi:AcrR family transcriptional regulator